MSPQTAVPDAWDDDWVDTASKTQPKQPEASAKLSKAERRQQHVEQQKQLWDTAENPGRNLWLESQGVVPLKQEFKPPVTLLSRKPPAIMKKDPATGMANLTLQDDGEDSEEEARKKREADFEERQKRAKVEREEKERRYAEARARIMGSSNPASSATQSRESSQGRDSRKSRTKPNVAKDRATPSGSPGTQSPQRGLQSDVRLFDPDDMGRRLSRRDESSTHIEDEPVRQPRGPDSAGRGGFGFANRGGKTPI